MNDERIKEIDAQIQELTVERERLLRDQQEATGVTFDGVPAQYCFE